MKSTLVRGISLFLTVVSSMTLFFAAQSEAYTVQERAISALASDAVHPAIWGDTIIWKDYRAGGAYLVTGFPTIYSYNLITGKEERITGPNALVYNGSNRGRTDIDIWENRIVWGDYRNATTTKGDVFLYDMVTRTERQITTNPATNYFPAIFGDLITYRDMRNDTTGTGSNDDIYLYDLKTDRETQITSQPVIQKYAQVYNNNVVWQDFRPTGVNIYLYDYSTGTERRIDFTGIGAAPNIFESKVVYYTASAKGDIYMVDLVTGVQTQITNDSAAQMYPDLSDTFIVWEDYRSDPLGDIYGYDMATGTEFPICTAPGAQLFPAIYGNHVTWMDKRNGNWDIYEADIWSGRGDLVIFEAPEPSSLCLMAAGTVSLAAMAYRRARKRARKNHE